MNLTKFKRLNEATSPELLGEDELTKLEDCTLDSEVGKIVKRDGWSKFNSTAIGGTIHSLYDVVADGGNNYLISGYGTTIKTSLDGTGVWGSAISGLSGIGKFQLQPYAGKFYLTDGVIAPKVLGGTTLADTWSLEITAPDIAGCVNSGDPAVIGVQTGQNTSGSLTASSMYKWVFTYVTREGIESPPSQPITHYDSSTKLTTTATDKCIGFYNLPISTDSRVTARRIYRTLADSEVYYFHSQIDNVIDSWYDNVADSDLGSGGFNFLNAPQTAKYSCVHKERLWLANQTRKVKNWIMPAHSKSDGTFNVIFNGATIAFTAGGGFDDTGELDISPATGLANGDYTYKILFIDKDGIMSDAITTNTVTISTANKGIRIYYPPIVDNEYTEVTSAYVYRKKDSGDYKYIGNYKANKVKTDTRLFTDTNITNGITYVTNQATDTELTGISFSDIAKPPDFILEDIRDVYPDDGDVITGIYDDGDGVLIFKENSICKIFTNGGPTNWNLIKLVHDIGAKANTIAKSNKDYYFVSKDANVYKFSSGSGAENIGWFIEDSLGTVTTFHSAVTDDSWYVLGVSGGSLTSSYGFLVYDLFTQSWYKFNSSGIPYASLIRKHGTDSGELLIANGQYVMYLNGTTDDGTDIVPIIRCKTFGDGITLNRLRNLWFNYKKLDGKTCTITIVNPDTGVTNTHSDTTNSTNASDYKLLEEVTGKDTDSLKETDKFYIQITGAGFLEWGDLRLDLRPIKRGRVAS